MQLDSLVLQDPWAKLEYKVLAEALDQVARLEQLEVSELVVVLVPLVLQAILVLLVPLEHLDLLVPPVQPVSLDHPVLLEQLEAPEQVESPDGLDQLVKRNLFLIRNLP